MGPREQDNDMLLLVAVSVLCGVFAVGASLLESTPSVAADSQVRVVSNESAADAKPVRVIIPFTPNIDPGTR